MLFRLFRSTQACCRLSGLSQKFRDSTVKIIKGDTPSIANRNQRRRQRTREAILAAAELIFRRKGIDGTVVNDITEQADVAKAYIAQLDQAHAFKKAIVTKIEPDRAFYPAENYHQDYLTHNPTNPYIAINDLPKVEDLKHLFPELYRPSPILVAGPHSSR